MTPSEHLSKIDAVASRPLLSNPADRALFFSRLIAQFTRQINHAKKGKPTPYTRTDLEWLVRELESRIAKTKELSSD